MLRPPFFPEPIFGWFFVALLTLITGTAAVIDLRYMKVPKWLTLGCLALGVLLNLVRAIWLTSQDQPVFYLNADTSLMGALDGLLFSTCGFGVGFALFFLFWVMGTCGGGDVKLVAALGAWLGPRYVLYVFFVSIVVVAFLMLFKMVSGGLGPNAIQRTLKRRPKFESPGGPVRKADRRRLTFSLPMAVAVVAVMLWMCRYDLGLASRPHVPVGTAEKEQAHALYVYSA